ncbi:hypothetical protein CGGC5_v010284 [Colletotrichum fructicola Nara gc5]|uniref:Uncharacterized protein n=1 Tax=Colletotrichum fructicola (strain Nara gc5) TaxID=1213859 RepID=A0A7J6IWL1_COLFN|nr:hypothetical protein CFRS1_v007721 [Colletotrichum fructicola]KAF4477277.1 hypothetical protein CGGC5_v013039 [Colletotrichum fructicola Nara gc5]KAF4481484.1 hypothetical protein CGGC5_v010284 [Colletotrichum fructicola Nara gc5]
MPRPHVNNAVGRSSPQPAVFVIRVKTIRRRGRPLKNPTPTQEDHLNRGLCTHLTARLCAALRPDPNHPSIPPNANARVVIVYERAADLDSVLMGTRHFSLFESHHLYSVYYGEPRPSMKPRSTSTTTQSTTAIFKNREEKRKASMSLTTLRRLIYQELRLIHVLEADYNKCPAEFKQAVSELPLPPAPEGSVPRLKRTRTAPSYRSQKRARSSSNRRPVGRAYK